MLKISHESFLAQQPNNNNNNNFLPQLPMQGEGKGKETGISDTSPTSIWCWLCFPISLLLAQSLLREQTIWSSVFQLIKLLLGLVLVKAFCLERFVFSDYCKIQNSSNSHQPNSGWTEANLSTKLLKLLLTQTCQTLKLNTLWVYSKKSFPLVYSTQRTIRRSTAPLPIQILPLHLSWNSSTSLPSLTSFTLLSSMFFEVWCVLFSLCYFFFSSNKADHTICSSFQNQKILLEGLSVLQDLLKYDALLQNNIKSNQQQNNPKTVKILQEFSCNFFNTLGNNLSLLLQRIHFFKYSSDIEPEKENGRINPKNGYLRMKALNFLQSVISHHLSSPPSSVDSSIFCNALRELDFWNGLLVSLR